MAPMRVPHVITLNRHEAVHKFKTNTIYKSSAWSLTSAVYMIVLSRTSDKCIFVQTVESAAFDEATRMTLEQSPVMKVALFTDKKNAEYSYVLSQRFSVLNNDVISVINKDVTPSGRV